MKENFITQFWTKLAAFLLKTFCSRDFNNRELQNVQLYPLEGIRKPHVQIFANVRTQTTSNANTF